MTLKDIQMKLYERLKPSGWGHKLRMFLLSEEFGKILKELHAQSQDGKRFTPVLKDVFSCFENCKYNDLKVVMVGSNPHNKAGVADGMLLSCKNNKKPEPPLRMVFQTLERTVYPDGMKWDTDLTRWANQGILLLNASLTGEIGSPVNKHLDLWEPFIIDLFELLSTYNTGIVYVFLGDTAKKLHKHVGKNNYKFFTSHPASAVYSKNGKWLSGDLFNDINQVLHNNNGDKIIW